MKEKITKLKDWYNSLNSTKQKLVKYGIIAFLSSFLGGYFAESAYRVSTNGLLGADNTSINFLLCPIYALIRANGLIYTLIITLAISGFLFIMEFRNQDLAKEAHEDDRSVAVAANPLYGSADWMQPEEIHKHFEIGPVKDVEGIILGQLDKEGKEAICLANNSPGNRNIMIFGSPGSGKSYGFVRSAVFQSVKNQASMVITDPKGEIHNDMRKFLLDNGYEVKLFDLVDLLYSDSWDCVSEIIDPKTGNANELRIAEFADAIMKNSGEGDEFWDGGEANLLKAIIFYQAYRNESAKVEKFTKSIIELCKDLSIDSNDCQQFITIIQDESTIMNDKYYCVRELAKRKAEQDLENGQRDSAIDASLTGDEYVSAWVEKYIADIDDWVDRRAPLHIDEIYRLLLNNDLAKWEECFKDIPLDNPAQLAWSIFKQNSDNARPQFITGLGQRMQLFQMRDLRRILRNKDIDLASIGDHPSKKKTALFCVMSDKSAAMKPITSLLFNFLFKDISDAADTYGPKTRNTVNMILDEFVNIGMIPNFEILISTVRSRKIGIFMICQTYSQLQETYGETNAETIIGCCDTLLCLGVNDKTTADFISYKSGVMTVVSKSVKDNRPTVLGYRPMNQGYSLSLGEGKRNVINPDEVMAMPFENVLLFRQHAKVLKANKFGYNLHPMFKEFSVKNEKGELELEQMPIISLLPSRKKYAATEDRDAFSAGTNKVKTGADFLSVAASNQEIASTQSTERFRQQQKRTEIPPAADMMSSTVKTETNTAGKGTAAQSKKKNKFGI